ncbi:MAG TPA: DUF3015 domain-containing protein [Campylobacterales bacterium]|nr:DUF3015 domain-containing protein [Arcobacter sp.]HHD80200.1 DUF3015 domain-containing protein [Campylobacterales bacterium]
MKKIRFTLSVIAMGVLFAPQVQARDLEGILKECGIGASIFKSTPAAAAISNIIWDLGTTATSSDLSSPESCKGGNAKVAMLIGNSYDTLETEIAEGKGKYLNTLSTLSGKSTTEIRHGFASFVSTDEYNKMTKQQKAQKLFDIAS